MSPSTGSGSRYQHHEAITISPLAVGRLGITLEATSVVLVSTSTGNGGLPATPFPSHVVELVRSHGLKRLLVQVGSSSSSSALAPTADTSEGLPPGATGPAGTSITAEFYTASDGNDGGTSIDDRAQSLLRSLVGSRLICAPLDSISIAKNQHYSYPSHRQHGNATATYQIVLPASAGHFCAEGLTSFRKNLLPCRSHAGLLANVPSTEMLLGTAPTAASTRLMRRGLWIDISVASARKEDEEEEGNCFSSNKVPRGDSDGVRCTISLQQGSTYGVEIDTIIDDSSSTPEQYYYSSSFSLGDILGDASSTLTHCPLADSSVINTILPPTIQRASFARPYQGAVIGDDEDNDEERGAKRYEYDLKTKGVADDRVVHDVQSIIDRYDAISLSEKWAAFALHGSATPNGIGSNLLSVDRTVDKPGGVANCGTFHSVYRNGASNDEDGVKIVVKTMDAYPKFVAPLLQSLKIRLYEGDGAGDVDFVPFRDSVFVDVQDFDLLPQNDGSLSIAVTKLLPPDSSLWISLEYKPRFLSFEHFPSDPNRGVDVLPSSGLFFLPNTGASNGIRLYSSSVIIMPPVPDMSMPFNVISLACTLYAFIVGSIGNFLVRKSSQSISDAYKGRKPRNKLFKLKEKLRRKLLSRRRKGHIDPCSTCNRKKEDDGRGA